MYTFQVDPESKTKALNPDERIRVFNKLHALLKESHGLKLYIM